MIKISAWSTIIQE